MWAQIALKDVADSLDIVAKGLSLLCGMVAVLWAYTKFVLERGLLPPVEFTVECTSLGKQRGKQLLEILFHIKNVGTSTLVAININARFRFILNDEELNVFADKAKPTFGRAEFPHSYIKSLLNDNGAEGVPMISVVPHLTFVQPGVDQIYTLVVVLPETAKFILAMGQFEYGKHPTRLQSGVIELSRRMGLINYSLKNVKKPHTIERAFRLQSLEGIGASP